MTKGHLCLGTSLLCVSYTGTLDLIKMKIKIIKQQQQQMKSESQSLFEPVT